MSRRQNSPRQGRKVSARYLMNPAHRAALASVPIGVTQDRTAMRLWYDRWHSDGVFCLIYSSRDAHCEADGVVGGMRSQPRVVNE